MSTEPQRILVAGGTGAIGRLALPSLRAAGHEVHALTRSRDSAAVAVALGAQAVPGDLLDRGAVAVAVRTVRPTVVVHLATALSGTRDLAPTNRLRIEGTRHLVAAAERAHVQRVIAQSIAFAYAPGPVPAGEEAPLDLDAADPAWRAAVAAIQHLEDTTLDAGQAVAVVLRFGLLYGPGTAFADPAALPRVERRSSVHVADAAHALVLAAGAGWGVYNIVDDASRGATSAKARAELGWTPTRPGTPVALETEEGS